MSRLIHELFISPIKALHSDGFEPARADCSRRTAGCFWGYCSQTKWWEGFMDNRASSVFALVRRCKDSSGLAEFALACCAMLILFCAVANAQTATGQFNGHVYDPSGAAVAGSKVKVQDPASGWTRTVQSNGEGLYELPLVPPGNYQITVTQAGFQKIGRASGRGRGE